jgi:hypothetical protein
MSQKLRLLVDEERVEEVDHLDLDKGEVVRHTVSPKDLCAELSITNYLKFTPGLRDLVLYTRKGRNGAAGQPVTLGTLGPFALVKITDGAVINQFSPQNFGKPMNLSEQSLRDLAVIFGGGKVSAKSSQVATKSV